MTRILLVDDDPDVLASTKELLQGFGYQVGTCKDSNEVLQTMLAERPDIVLHDVRMPGLDLRGQIQSIRRNPRLSHTPIILFTAVLSARELANEVGADDAIEKPFTRETLRRVLQKSEMRAKLLPQGN